MVLRKRKQKNGVGIILKKEHVDMVVELWRVTDRIICFKMELGGVMLNVISAYAPQVGCIREEKEAFWLDLLTSTQKWKFHPYSVKSGIISCASNKSFCASSNILSFAKIKLSILQLCLALSTTVKPSAILEYQNKCWTAALSATKTLAFTPKSFRTCSSTSCSRRIIGV